LIRYAPVAKRELVGQLAYLASVNPDAADRLEAEVARALALLDTGTVDGPRVVLSDRRQAHRWLVPPLLIFYLRRRRGEVYVLRVRHGAQRPITRR
jgi:plasmid stabilization system protein ParE